MPLEAVEQFHHFVVDRAILHRLGKRDQHIDAEVEVLRDHRRVPIVAGFGPQLGHALMQVAHLDTGRLIEAKHKKNRTDDHQTLGQSRPRDQGHPVPEDYRLFLAPGHPLAVAGPWFEVGQHQRQQDKVGHDNRRHTDAGRDGQLTDGRHRDEKDSDEADGVGQQCHAAGNQ